MEGVEPSTSGFVVRRSDPIELHGLVGEVGSSEGRSRTCNRRLNRAPHCQLCYLEMKQGCGQDARVTRRVRELNPQGCYARRFSGPRPSPIGLTLRVDEC